MPQIAPLSWFVIPFFIFFLLFVLLVGIWWLNKDFYCFSLSVGSWDSKMIWKW